MAFHQPTPAPRQPYTSSNNQEESTLTYPAPLNHRVEDSQEWILFSPSQAASSITGIQTDGTPRSVSISRISDSASIPTRSGHPTQSNVDDSLTEDAELDSLDEGLQAFQEPSGYQPTLNHGHGAVLPTHDGFGTFPASSGSVQDQIWRHDQYNPKRKYEGSHLRRSLLQSRLETIEELDLQISEEKRMRIEQWRTEQIHMLQNEIEKKISRTERKSHITKNSSSSTQFGVSNDWLRATTELDGVSRAPVQETEELEPFWRRAMRKFIRDVIGIDEPLLSVIVGETLPEDMHAIADLIHNGNEDQSPDQLPRTEDTWPDRLLHRIARELGLLANKLSPHPATLSAASSSMGPDFPGIILSERTSGELESSQNLSLMSSLQVPLFLPTVQSASPDALCGVEVEPPHDQDGATAELSDLEGLRREREYWERELDIRMVFRFLAGRFSSNTDSRRQDTPCQPISTREDSSRRADVIRQNHPLVARTHRPSMTILQQNAMLQSSEHSANSCATESVKHSLARSGSNNRNYWDVGGSVGSGSVIASGGMMGAWAEA